MKHGVRDEIDNLLLTVSADIKTALKLLDKEARRILFVVDENTCLLGSLTDGDIRRFLLKGGSLQDAIDNAYFKTPFCVKPGYQLKRVRQKMLEDNLPAVPVVSESGRIHDVLFWESVFQGKKRIPEPIGCDVVIMAGGKGTRMEPFSRIFPKPLVPIGDQTILEMILDLFSEHGASEFYCSLNYKGELIDVYLSALKPARVVNRLWEGDDFLGTAGSLRLLPDRISETFVVTNCDVLVKTDYAELLKFHHKNQNVLTIVGSLKHIEVPYGILSFGESGRLESIQEKPELDFTISTGVYVLNRSVLEKIPAQGCYHMTDLIADLIKAKAPVGVFPAPAHHFIDFGQWPEYQAAMEKLKLLG